MAFFDIPPVEAVDTDKEHVYQGVGIRNLDQAVLQGWKPVKATEEKKVGINWPVGPNGFRMFQEQVLCRMPREHWEELQKEIDARREALSIEVAEEEYREAVGGAATGSIIDE